MSVIESPIIEQPQAAALASEAAAPHPVDGVRELIESIVVAFVLAFLFRTFIAEAFVIPTGSMAPTLMGRHKDVECPECGWRYQVGASDEADPRSGRPLPPARKEQIVEGVCPMCRYQATFVTILEAPSGGYEFDVLEPSYKGDRILVDKGAYHFHEPRRWDVIVFKCPHEAETNFIKRLVGLPGETVRIERGDLYVKRAGQSTLELARKPADKVQAVLQPVYDNDYVSSWMTERGWPLRWGPQDESQGGWQVLDEGRQFSIEAGGQQAWLEYRHFVPTQEEWAAMKEGPLAADHAVRPQLISDSSAYNSDVQARSLIDQGSAAPPLKSMGFHWVGDLAVECEVTFADAAADGRLTLCLVRAGRRFECVLKPSAGTAELAIEGLASFAPRATVELPIGAAHRVAFANVDRQLFLWIDGRLVEFPGGTEYDDLHDPRPTGEDLRPVRIGALGLSASIRRLRVLRDNYYIATRVPTETAIDYLGGTVSLHWSDEELAAFLSDESRWSVFATGMNREDFSLKADQFFMLGDNSASSMDGRMWPREHYVRRDLLVGKAIFVYWPHAWPTTSHMLVPGTELRLPFFPQFGRMGWIR